MAKHNEIGKWGENLACDKLTSEGWAIAERNWREGHLELDIVAISADTIVFAEVKTRASMEEAPLEVIDRRKIANMVRAANAYLAMHPELRQYPRFDLFAINGNPENYRLEHLPDAFDPPLRTY
ncbi:MAG: YraN family protein [Muribaculaceae bacterium]|nr:YraN family protein [Muribaculaceae bacterium]